jgi:hypothetical protein
MENKVKLIKNFTRFYNSMVMRWESKLMRKGFSLPELWVLFELEIGSACTKRELASRLHLPVVKMDEVFIRLIQAKLVKVEHEGMDDLFRKLVLTKYGLETVVSLREFYDEMIAKDVKQMGEVKRLELMEHLQKARKIMADF